MPQQNPEHAYTEYVPELPAGERFSEHHIKVHREDVSRYVFVPGNHLRGRRIAEMLDDARVIGATREAKGTATSLDSLAFPRRRRYTTGVE